MKRRLLVSLAVVTASATALALPSSAATKAKPKPKPIKGSYALTLLPDPTYEVLATAGMTGCAGLNPASKDSHPFAVPAAGTLDVSLSSPDPTGGGLPLSADWDLYLLDADGSILSESTGGTANEQVVVGFKKKQAVTIAVCNNTGEPSGTVSYTFTYK